MGIEQSVEASAVIKGDDSGYEEISGNGLPCALVVCGPSGVGKGTLVDLLLQESSDFGFCVSHTTREPRTGEIDGVNYNFVSKRRFEEGIDNDEFLEYARVHENYYGTSREAVQSFLDTGKCCILDIDVQGVRQVRDKDFRALFVLIVPPSMEDLEKRLRGRDTETEEQIQIRLQNAKEELESINETGLFDYCLVNGDLKESYKQFKNIAYKAKHGQIPEPLLSNRRSPFQKRLLRERCEFSKEPNGVDENEETNETFKNNSDGMVKWRGRVVLVTGATSKIGQAICLKLAHEGMRVVAVGKKREQLELLQKEILTQNISSKDFLPVLCDISKEGEVSALVKIVTKRWPETPLIEVLINNPGQPVGNFSLVNGSTSTWLDLINSNILSICICTREIIQIMQMKNQCDGHIINICVSAEGGSDNNGFLKIMNDSVKSLTRELRHEVNTFNWPRSFFLIYFGLSACIKVKELSLPLKVSCISPNIHEEHQMSIETGDLKDQKNNVLLKPSEIADAITWTLSIPQHIEIQDLSFKTVI